LDRKPRRERANEEYTGADPIGFVAAENLPRRHLTTSQRTVPKCANSNIYYRCETSHREARGRPENLSIDRFSQKDVNPKAKLSIDRLAKKDVKQAAGLMKGLATKLDP